ncbi:MAG: PQQ-binding-like beta-propeller repeat protein, partial [Planctomycetota bacterium]
VGNGAGESELDSDVAWSGDRLLVGYQSDDLSGEGSAIQPFVHLFDASGVQNLIVWTPESVNSLDPANGNVRWSQPFKIKASLSIPTPIFNPSTHRLFVTAFYDGPLMLQLDRNTPAAKVAWKGTSSSERKTDKLHSIMCTPVEKDGYLYGVCSYGQLRCLKADTGERVWETLEATGSGRWWNAFITPHQDRYFISNEQGELIIASLTPEGYKEDSRVKILDPTGRAQRRKIVWSHPAYANRSVYARNDKEIVCVDLAASSN